MGLWTLPEIQEYKKIATNYEHLNKLYGERGLSGDNPEERSKLLNEKLDLTMSVKKF